MKESVCEEGYLVRRRAEETPTEMGGEEMIRQRNSARRETALKSAIRRRRTTGRPGSSHSRMSKGNVN